MTYTTYNPQVIEPKWQKVWEKENLYKTPGPSEDRPKKYILDMYPYPSGAVLHVGHMEGYVGTDVVCRYLRMKGFSVLHPMGWDAFGLPAENYAIKTGVPPDESTHKNIDTFRKQLKMLGLSYDWEREVDTSSPDYYKWTQWLFILLFKMGLAYKKKAPANWCSSCETVLANEQVVDGKCERCGTEVVQKDLDQWFFKITAYADRLIEGLDRIDWPKSTKLMQKNWIGRKEWIDIVYPIEGTSETITVSTTRPDTNFGATFIVLAPEHPFVVGKLNIIPEEYRQKVVNYAAAAKKKTERERMAEGRKKTGVFTGLYAKNLLNDYRMPIWVADFALTTVGTGAVVGVPAHDLRDFEFAREFDLEVVRVVVGKDGDKSPVKDVSQVQEEEGTMINSQFLDGLDIHEATKKIMDFLEEKGWGKRTVRYHLRDWLVSRQRYWGAPIPMILCEKCQWQPVPEKDLPVLLPTDVDFEPKGESPIAKSKSFQKGVKCPKCGGEARREVDTMDTFVDSSWYFLRFLDPRNDKEFAGRDTINKWMPVDIYVGGGHTVQHLLFARFFQKALVDAGLIDKGKDEPFLRLEVPGWILGPDFRKMSKRWSNVITPDEVVAKYGADTMRIYEMFMAPFEVDKPWNVDSVAGVYRFVNRVYKLFCNDLGRENLGSLVSPAGLKQSLAKLVAKVGSDIETFNFNTAVSAMMEFVNAWEKAKGLSKIDLKIFLSILAPFAPHLAEELYQGLGERVKGLESVHLENWPEVTASEEEEISTIAVTVDGKVRATLEFGSQELEVLGEKGIVQRAQSNERVVKYLTGETVKKTVYVPGRIVNFVTK